MMVVDFAKRMEIAVEICICLYNQLYPDFSVYIFCLFVCFLHDLYFKYLYCIVLAGQWTKWLIAATC